MPDGTIIDKKDYEPFGKEISGGRNRTGFINKGKDNESALLDIGVRKYDSEIGRFTSCDPLFEKFYQTNPYQYCFNNPISLIDVDGLKPGDPFNTPQEAAKDWGTFYNGFSIAFSREYGSLLYEYKDSENQTKYSYTSVVIGGTRAINIESGTDIPSGTSKIGSIHSHGSYLFYMDDLNNEIVSSSEGFSGSNKSTSDSFNDIGGFKFRGYKIAFVTTSSGKLFEWNITDGIIKKPLSTNLPADIQDPKKDKDNKNVVDTTKWDVPQYFQSNE